MIAAEQFRRRLMGSNLNIDSGYAVITTLSSAALPSGTVILRICGSDFDISQIESISVDGANVAVARTLSLPVGQKVVRINYRNLTTCRTMFDSVRESTDDGRNIISVHLDISGVNTSLVGDMSSMFEGSNLRSLTGVENINVSKVTDMSYMFNGVIFPSSEVDLSGWDTSKVTDFRYFLATTVNSANELRKVNLSGWDTSKATDMSYMFYRVSSLRELTMTGPTNPSANVTGMFSSVRNAGTFYYDPQYDYSHIIAQLPSNWTAKPVTQ